MEEICFFEMLVSTNKSTWHYYPEDQHQHTKFWFKKYKGIYHMEDRGIQGSIILK
jgi:hypothetical protein